MNKKRIYLCLISICYAAIGHIQTSSADSPRNSDEIMEEVLVTALKRGGQSLVDAAAGITSIDGGAIEDMGADSLTDFLQLSPGTSIDSSANTGATNIAIRGINTTFGSASVGFYMDDLPFSLVNINFLPNPSPFDLERVEVLKGPQGTLYGAGSSGGVVLIKTKDPVLDAVEGKIDISASQTSDGDDNYSASAALNVPLIEDILAIRAAVSFQDMSGWIDDNNLSFGGQPLPPGLPAPKENVNSNENFSGRIKIHARPTERLGIMLSAVASRMEDDLGNNLADDSGEQPLGLFSGFFGSKGFNKTDYDQYGLNISYEFDTFTLSNALGYIDWKSDYESAFLGSLPTSIGAETTTNELRLTSKSDGPLSWVTGWYYRDAEQSIFQNFASFGLPFNLDEISQSEQYSVYAEGNMALMDGLFDVTLGLSYFSDDTETSSPIFGNLDVDSSQVSPQVTLAYHPGEASTIYFRYAEGFRAATTDFAFSTLAAQAVDPTIDGLVDLEENSAFEAGYKAEFLDGSLYAELMLFYNDISDIQQSSSVFVPGFGAANTVINAGDATTKGVEWLIRSEPLEGLTLTFSGSYTDAEIDDDFFSPGFLGGAVPLFSGGTRLNLVPELVLNGTSSYSWSLGGSGLVATASATAQYSSDRAITVLAAPSIEGDAVTRVDMRFEVGRDNWSLYVFAENALDEDGMVSGTAFTSIYPAAGLPADGLNGSRMRPRTIGAGLRYNF